ncbi:hypothetical protein [Gulosibacter sediminis]|uniref:hypothetical protein n=1 Tax=Gulosibacter sediminis TaxID=1729695 RepID=UPI0039A455F7
MRRELRPAFGDDAAAEAAFGAHVQPGHGARELAAQCRHLHPVFARNAPKDQREATSALKFLEGLFEEFVFGDNTAPLHVHRSLPTFGGSGQRTECLV